MSTMQLFEEAHIAVFDMAARCVTWAKLLLDITCNHFINLVRQYWLGQCQWVLDKRSNNTFYSCGSQIKYTRENYSIPLPQICSIPMGFVIIVFVWPYVICMPSKHERLCWTIHCIWTMLDHYPASSHWWCDTCALHKNQHALCRVLL